MRVLLLFAIQRTTITWNTENVHGESPRII